MVSQQALASDGTITFNGEIVANTCVVNGGNGNFTVTLPKVGANSLAAIGATAGRTPFQIALSGCSWPDGTKVHSYFEAGTTVDSTTGKLITGNSTVQIALLNADGNPITAGSPDATQASQQATQMVVVTNGAATLPYFAEYYATQKAVPGMANTMVVYTIVYN
nr:fimbrial protein [Ramlibacter monticola]